MRNSIGTYILTSSVLLCLESITQAAPQLPASCEAGQALTTDSNGQLVCQQLPPGAILPSCRKYSEALTADGKSLSCVARNNESAAARTALDNMETSEALLASYGMRLSKLQPVPQAAYCGSTATATAGRFSSGGVFGLHAASALCSQVAACGATARMCTVYDMYNSVASGVIKPTDTIPKSWAYMASWQTFGTTVEPTAGLSDNCGAYTSNDPTNNWYGTAIKWEVANTGLLALKVYTGPTGANEGAPCNVSLPIACCK